MRRAEKTHGMTFNQKFRRLMSDRHGARVAKRAGVSAQAIASYLAGAYEPRTGTALRLAAALNVDFQWLVDDRRDWPPVWLNHEEPATAA